MWSRTWAKRMIVSVWHVCKVRGKPTRTGSASELLHTRQSDGENPEQHEGRGTHKLHTRRSHRPRRLGANPIMSMAVAATTVIRGMVGLRCEGGAFFLRTCVRANGQGFVQGARVEG